MILGGGPNRIGQGIEFDYCCCHASFALRELGIESVMVNSNPETVSTDYDTSDMLFFEPLTVEDVLNICDRVQPDGVIVQFGGQTPLNLARRAGRRRRADHRHQRRHDRGGRGPREVSAAAASSWACSSRPTASPARWTRPGARRRRSAIRCWCGRASCSAAGRWRSATTRRSSSGSWPRRSSSPQGQPVLIDRFLEDATEVDVDCISDGDDVIVAGIMEHIEEAGVHSGDSACAIPPYSLPGPVVQEIREATHRAWPGELNVVGLMNVQFAVKKEDGRHDVYVLEVNPRASRTVPFVAKATGMPVAKIAAKVMAGVIAGRAGHHARADSRARVGEGKRVPVHQVPASTSCSARRCDRPAK